MKYALNLAEDGRVLSATYEKYAPLNAELVEKLPEGDLSEYLYVNGEYVHEPLDGTQEAFTGRPGIIIENI